MYVYWRIQQDLKSMGETLVFHAPSLIRCFRIWMQKNAGGLALAEDFRPDPNVTENWKRFE